MMTTTILVRIALSLGLTLAALHMARAGDLPDPTKTPGAINTDGNDVVALCGKVGGQTYEKRHRAALTTAIKQAITRSYGQTPGRDGDHELDHLYPAALGGRSDASNVWWQPGRGHGTVWDYHVKDRLDTWAWRQVCGPHKMSPAQARAYFLPDWRAGYCAAFSGAAPCPTFAGTAPVPGR